MSGPLRGDFFGLTLYILSHQSQITLVLLLAAQTSSLEQTANTSKHLVLSMSNANCSSRLKAPLLYFSSCIQQICV